MAPPRRPRPFLLQAWLLWLARCRAASLRSAPPESPLMVVGDLEVSFPQVRGPADPWALQAVYVACGEDSCNRGRDAVRSFLAQAKLDRERTPALHPTPVLHLFLDEACARQMEELQRSQPSLAKEAHFKIYITSQIRQTPVGMNLYKDCASLRLSLPRLLPHLPKLLYMDTDTLVVGSLQRLWKLDPYLWAFGENDPGWYEGGSRCPPHWREHMPMPAEEKAQLKTCGYGGFGINSGVMLLNQNTWRRRNLEKEVNDLIQTLTQDGKYPQVLLMGDQDIFNMLAVAHEKDYYTMMLPCEMNSIFLNRYMCYYGSGKWSSFSALHPVNPTNASGLARNSRQPVIIHGKFHYNGAGKPLWVHLHQQVLEAVDTVSDGKARGARSLCEVAGGCDLN